MFACLSAYAYPPGRAQLIYCQGGPYIPYPPGGVFLVYSFVVPRAVPQPTARVKDRSPPPVMAALES